MENKYHRGKIYKLVCNVTGDVYYGSTVEKTLARRLSGHIRDYKSYLKGNHAYVTSFSIIEKGDYDIVLVEKYNCETKDDLRKRERHYVEDNVCINKQIPNKFNSVGFKKYHENYRIENKDRLNRLRKKPCKCVCGHIYSNRNKSRHFRSKIHHKDLLKKIVDIQKYQKKQLLKSQKYFVEHFL